MVKNLPASAEDSGLDPTHYRATNKPICHNYRACAIEPGNHNYWAHVPQLRKPAHPRAHALQTREVSTLQPERKPSTPQLVKTQHSQK